MFGINLLCGFECFGVMLFFLHLPIQITTQSNCVNPAVCRSSQPNIHSLTNILGDVQPNLRFDPLTHSLSKQSQFLDLSLAQPFSTFFFPRGPPKIIFSSQGTSIYQELMGKNATLAMMVIQCHPYRQLER